ncbi:hypothetical protein HR45_03420 [Shewanella mangrovi]|uniref:Uncharacterized protein n=1 Tax=Shewanella mangrovi TaxID=1515746 RepID=A0A094K1G8_9GAMM|nr:hypothetical protein [Shewanella mangrovi]KFZ38491.1 hypothetical protein HR45_03420 [Shewanella mangrovi]
MLALLLLLYFGNSHQDLSQFVLADIGRQQFERYEIRLSDRPYHDTAELQSALQLAALTTRWYEQVERKQPIDLEDYLALLPGKQTNKILERRRQRLLFHIG